MEPLQVKHEPTEDASSDVVNMEVIADYACETGENPLWHPSEKRLYWCDIPRGRIFRYDPISRTHELCYQGRPVGGFTIQVGGSLLLFMDRGTVAVWRDGVLHEVVPEIPDEASSRFNDVIADPSGRVFCGTMSTNERSGRLYRLDPDGSIHIMLENIGCSNGMAFSLDQKEFYYTDSFAGKIYLFDFNSRDGSLSNQRTFATFSEADGLPDGATIDAGGYLWSALWGGSAIVRLDREGRIQHKIEFPTRKISSLTFGGETYQDLYITSAGGDMKAENGPSAGSLFRVQYQARGVPEYHSHIKFR